MNYKKYNDYELIYNVRENDDNSYNDLFNKYIPIMKRLAYNYYNKYSNYGYDLEDFQQEAFIAFHSAVNNFSESKNILFYTFVTLCINRSLLSFCKKISCEMKNISNKYLINIDDNNIVGNSNIDDYCDYSDIKTLFNRVYLELNFEDSCIFELRYNGFSYKEISELLDLSLRRVQFKVRKVRNIVNSKK